MTDRQLLASYIERNDHAAFGELVRRHVDWVHSMARRLVRDEALAADVTQGVFALLARKAGRLDGEVTLSGWLFLVTRFSAMRMSRDESRRRAHERKAAAMRSVIQEPADSIDFEELAPMLDELVARLHATDRRAVILRFYERKTFPEIGQALQMSEEAARKRVERSVEKMRGWFGQRGVTVGSLGLATAMAANLTQPAGAAVVVGATAASAGAGAGMAQAIGWAMLMAWIKPLAAALGLIVALTAGTVMILQQPATTAQSVAAPAAPAPAGDFRYGRVVSLDDKPIAGAKIVQIDFRADPDDPTKIVADAITDADGRFRLPKVGSQLYAYTLVHGTSYAYGGRPVFSQSAEDPKEIVLLPATTLKVRFVDPDGKPAAGLRVALTGMGESRNGWRSEIPSALRDSTIQVADADGVCNFPNLPQGGMAWFHHLDARYAQFRFYPWFELADAPASDGGTVRLKAAASISGKVVYANTGLPAAKVRVMATNDGSGGQEDAYTDEQGRYTLKQLNADNYCAFLFLSNEMMREVAAVALENLRVLPGMHLENQDFVLIRGGIIRGKITERDTGRPLANFGVFVDGPSRPGHTSTIQQPKTDSAGEYLIHVPPGQQKVQIALPLGIGYATPDVLTHEVTVADGQTVEVNYEVARVESAPLRGRTVDPQGRPLPSVEIYVVRDRDRWEPGEMKTISDAQGRFEIDNVEPRSLLRARKGKWSTLAPIRAEPNPTLTLHPDAHASIKVTVRQPDGSPVPNAKIELTTDNSSIGQKPAASDGTGVFRALAPDMGYRVVARAKGFAKGEVKLRVEPGKTAEPPAIVLTPARGILGGKVIRANGEPVPDARVTIFGPQTEEQTVVSDVNGQFRAEDLTEGDSLRVIVNESADYDRSSTTLAPGITDAVIILQPRTAP